MKIWKWSEGRQESCKYFKFPIWYFRIGRYGFDAYILKYEPGVLPIHIDPVNGKHYRMNILINGRCNFTCEKTIFKNWFITIFRPDLYLHCLIITSKTTKLSFGFVKFNENEK